MFEGGLYISKEGLIFITGMIVGIALTLWITWGFVKRVMDQASKVVPHHQSLAVVDPQRRK